MIYRPQDVKSKEVTRVQSHFVLRRPDAMWLDGRPLEMPVGTAEKPAEVSLEAPPVSFCCYGTAALGVRVPWCGAADGRKAEIKLVDDGNAWHCLRLMHRSRQPR